MRRCFAPVGFAFPIDNSVKQRNVSPAISLKTATDSSPKFHLDNATAWWLLGAAPSTSNLDVPKLPSPSSPSPSTRARQTVNGDLRAWWTDCASTSPSPASPIVPISPFGTPTLSASEQSALPAPARGSNEQRGKSKPTDGLQRRNAIKKGKAQVPVPAPHRH
ncbi:hypothetical protein CBOM_00356 [Ceraceosorus bombacis]|uniref:Uncharacterized protein n=1 Tax=Ceraceosorus bombacis TaxID=401625 RepID=A0A0P1BAX4_9BASI|nr:hypothetical protein CBOM_00356 [Ceraceosorus bombacis]